MVVSFLRNIWFLHKFQMCHMLEKRSVFLFKKNLINLFFDWMIIALQNLFFVKPQHESAIGIHMSPTSWSFVTFLTYIFFLFYWNWNLPVYPFPSGLWAPWGQLMVWHRSAESVAVWVDSLSFIQRYLLSLLLCSNF